METFKTADCQTKIGDEIRLWLTFIHHGLLFKRKHLLRDGAVTANYQATQDFSKTILHMTGTHINCSGLENIPDVGRTVIVANHRSFIDIYVLFAAVDRVMRFIADEKLFHTPLLKDVLTALDCISITSPTELKYNRKDLLRITEQINNITKALKAGACLTLFPEGECNYYNDQIQNFHAGAFRSLLKTDCVVVPAYLGYSDIIVSKFLNRKERRWTIPVGDVELTFGAAYKPSELTADDLQRFGIDSWDDNKIDQNGLSRYTRARILALQENRH